MIWKVSSNRGSSLLNSTVAEPRGPVEERAKFGAPSGEETIVSRVGDVEPSSDIASLR